MSAPSTASSAPERGSRTAWVRSRAAPLRDFFQTESGGAVVLLLAALLALVWANSPWWTSYEDTWTTTLSIRLGGGELSRDLREWINSGLMTFYFLVVGLEAKRELDIGQLRERRRLAVPAAAALGGMAMAVGVYLAVNAGGDGAGGWGAAMSSDTAFVLGVLALAAPRAVRLRIRLLTVLVVDDLVALVVIAVAYSEHLSVVPLLVAFGLFGALVALRYVDVAWRGQLAVGLGVAFWGALLQSGIDPVVAGLAVGLITAAYPPGRTDLEQVTELTRSFREQPTPELARSAQRGVASAVSINERLQFQLHPWTSYVIVPLFALANAGVHVGGGLLGDAITSPITLGIVAAYVVGKPLGILTAAFAIARAWRGRVQLALSWPVIGAGGAVAGIPFTVSLLIASIAFDGRELAEAKVGVLAAAVLATLVALACFRLIARMPRSRRAQQLLRTSEDLVDLSVDVDPERDHVRGEDDAPVTLVEYGDYECPYCGRAEPVIRDLLAAHGDDIRYVWRHLPLSDVHPHAELAAEAAEAAGAQGAYWTMHDRLFQHQDALEPEDLVAYAADLGLDLDRFRADLDGRRFAERVAEDIASADASDATGTPSFFINGQRHRGAYDLPALTAAVTSARARATLLREARQVVGAGEEA